MINESSTTHIFIWRIVLIMSWWYCQIYRPKHIVNFCTCDIVIKSCVNGNLSLHAAKHTTECLPVKFLTKYTFRFVHSTYSVYIEPRTFTNQSWFIINVTVPNYVVYAYIFFQSICTDDDYRQQIPTNPALPLTNQGLQKDMCGKEVNPPMGKFLVRRCYVQGRS